MLCESVPAFSVDGRCGFFKGRPDCSSKVATEPLRFFDVLSTYLCRLRSGAKAELEAGSAVVEVAVEVVAEGMVDALAKPLLGGFGSTRTKTRA